MKDKDRVWETTWEKETTDKGTSQWHRIFHKNHWMTEDSEMSLLQCWKNNNLLASNSINIKIFLKNKSKIEAFSNTQKLEEFVREISVPQFMLKATVLAEVSAVLPPSLPSHCYLLSYLSHGHAIASVGLSSPVTYLTFRYHLCYCFSSFFGVYYFIF